MSYRKIAKNLKGMHILWNNNTIFPNYKYTSGPIVSKKRINNAQKIVTLILIEEQNKITNAFKLLAKKRHKSKNIKINIDFDSALNCVKNVKLTKENDDLYGVTDGYTIWISPIKMSYEYLVGTILHESLHHICTFDNKSICGKDEHYVMRLLGDDC
tara:strand:- start:34 stop:504 length:471 start_codon:yes stop_codon:yes gene_type:complete